jgi:heavy metal translocating P-type ATPase
MKQMAEVYLNGKSRARIVGVGRNSREARKLTQWLDSRSDVLHFEQRKSTGVFQVHFDDGGDIPGRFIRSLKDKLSKFLHRRNEPMTLKPVHSLGGRVRIEIGGMDNQHFESLTAFADSIPKVTRTKYLPSSKTVLIEYDSSGTTEASILKSLCEKNPADWPQTDWAKPIPLRWGGAVSCTVVLAMCLTRAFPFHVMAIGISLNTIRPLRRSLDAFLEGKVSIDLLDVAATFAALLTGRPATAAFVIWTVGVGDLLLDVSASSTRDILSKLLLYTSKKVDRLLPNGHTEQVSIDQLERGDHFIVHVGHGIAADGVVVSGKAEVDEKALTGESKLALKKKGDRVFASTLTVEGRIVVEVESAGKNTEAAKIESLLRGVGNKPLTMQRDALNFAGKLVIPTFGVAGAAAAFASDVDRGVCILITDFGTGIRIAVPTCALIAMELAAREGVLLKGAQYLERLAKTDVIIFDKTGTLTSGKPEVIEILTAKGFENAELIRLAASAETGHDHPVAQALRSYAERHQITLTKPELGSQESLVGLGVSAKIDGHRVLVGRASWIQDQKLKVRPFKKALARLKKIQVSTLCVAVDDRVVGIIGYADNTRPESAAIIRKLQAGGRRKVVLLSGDDPEVVKKVALEIGADEAIGGLLPNEKAKYIKKQRAAGRIVAMVGDGINDAPALALADVGISFAGSTDVAIETADVILLDGGIIRLARAFELSEQAMARVRENIGVVIVPNAIAIFLGAFGFINPPVAAIINNGATLAAVLVGTFPLLNAPPRRTFFPPAEPRVGS